MDIIKNLMDVINSYWNELHIPIAAAVLSMLFCTITSICYWCSYIRKWWLSRIRLIFDHSRPSEYVIRGKHSDNGRDIILDPPRFVNIKLRLTIRNRSTKPYNMTLDELCLCYKEPSKYRKEGRWWSSEQWRKLNSSLATLDYEIMGDNNSIVSSIDIPPRSSRFFTIRATATNQSFQTEPYVSWKLIWLQFKDADGKEHPLCLTVSQTERRYTENIQPYFEIPPHYIQSQGGIIGV